MAAAKWRHEKSNQRYTGNFGPAKTGGILYLNLLDGTLQTHTHLLKTTVKFVYHFKAH